MLGATKVSAPGAGSARDTPALRAVEANQALREHDLEDAQASADAARGEIAQLEAQLNELSAAQASGEQGVSDKRLRLAALSVQERELNGRLGGDQAQLARLLGALELFRRDPPPALFVKPTDVRDAVRAAILIRAITPELEKRAKVLKGQAQALRSLRQDINASSADIIVGEHAIADRRTKIEALIAQKTDLQAHADADAEAARQDIDRGQGELPAQRPEELPFQVGVSRREFRGEAATAELGHLGGPVAVRALQVPGALRGEAEIAGQAGRPTRQVAFPAGQGDPVAPAPAGRGEPRLAHREIDGILRHPPVGGPLPSGDGDQPGG